MDINGSRLLILGGAGLVGMAITRRMLKHHNPDTIIITSLFQKEVDDRSICTRRTIQDPINTHISLVNFDPHTHSEIFL